MCLVLRTKEWMDLSKCFERSFSNARPLEWWIWRSVAMSTRVLLLLFRETALISCLFFHMFFPFGFMFLTMSKLRELRFTIEPKPGSKMLWRPNQIQLTGLRATNIASFFLSEALEDCNALKKVRFFLWVWALFFADAQPT